MDVITIPYAPRERFKPFHDRTKRWSVIVAHRRCGKTVACINDLIKAALTSTKPNPRFAYLAPYHAQAKDVAWDYLKHYAAPIPNTEANESELRLDFPNGARIRLYGAENADRMRGLYLDGIVIDEPADIKSTVWPEIIRPALSDRQGWATWIGTPKGKNAFWDIWKQAGDYPEDWYASMLRASETGYVNQKELDEALKTMSEDQYAQEFECSFEAAIQGAYYGKLINEAQKEGRIGRVPWEPKLPVHTAWDLGIGDSTAIWFAQQTGMEVRIIDYYESSGVGLEHYVKVLESKKYIYGDHILPHDVEVADLSTGRTRLQFLASLGLYGRVLQRDSVEDGISAARNLLPQCWFDAEKCERGLEALRQYRTEYDDKLKTFKNRPLHDWTSHACLTGDAIIKTTRGDIAIKNVREGDYVYTPAGYALVERAGPVKVAKSLIEITTSDGRTIQATDEHKFFTNRGLVTADALRYSDILLSEGDEVCAATLSYSTATNTGFRESITAVTTGANAGRHRFIARFGNIITGQFQKAMRFITETAMGLTTTYPTWSVSTHPNISGSMRLSGSQKAPLSPQVQRPLLWPLNGTLHQMVWSGTDNTASGHGKAASGMNANAKSAGESSDPHTRLAPNSAIRIVSKRRLEGVEASQLVYDLTVRKHHCYLANGFLVSNSDAFRYLARGLPDQSHIQPKRDRYARRSSSTGNAWAAL